MEKQWSYFSNYFAHHAVPVSFVVLPGTMATVINQAELIVKSRETAVTLSMTLWGFVIFYLATLPTNSGM